jgi:hypothetical protein
MINAFKMRMARRQNSNLGLGSVENVVREKRDTLKSNQANAVQKLPGY